MADNLTKTRNDLAWVVDHKTIGDVLFSLGRLAEGEMIEEGQLENLRVATERILKSRGYTGGINILDEYQREKILAFLAGVDEKTQNEELSSKSLTSKELELLVAEYEVALANKEIEKATMLEGRLREIGGGHNIEGFIEEQKRLYFERMDRSEVVKAMDDYDKEVKRGENKETAADTFFNKTELDVNDLSDRQRIIRDEDLGELAGAGVPEKIIKETAITMTVEESIMARKLEKKIGKEKAGETARMMIKMAMVEAGKKGLVDFDQLRRRATRVANKAGVGVEMIKEVFGEIEEVAASIRVETELGVVAEKIIKRIVEEGIEEEVGGSESKRLKEKIKIGLRNWGGRGVLRSEEKEAGEILATTNKNRDEKTRGSMVVLVREARVEVGELVRANKQAFEIVTKRDLRKEIVDAIIGSNPKVDPVMVEKYVSLVTDSYTYTTTEFREGVKNRGEERMSPGETEEDFLRAQVFHGMLEKGKIREVLNSFEQIVNLPLSAVDKIGPARAFNGIMRVLLKNPKMVKTLELARKIVRIEDTMGSWRGKALIWIGKQTGWKGLQAMGSTMLSGVVMREVFRNSMIIIGKQGLSSGISMIGSSLIKGGTAKLSASAVSMTAKKGAEGLVAKGVTWMAGVLGGATGPPGWVVAGVVWLGGKVLGVVKKVIKGARESLEKLGINIPIATQIQNMFSWTGRQLKKMPLLGGILGKLADFTGELMYLVGTVGMISAIGAITALIAPVVIAVFVGVFAWQMFQSSQIASLVPPVGIGGGEQIFENTGIGVSNISLPEWSTTLELPESCPKGFPVSKGTISQGWGAGACSHRNMSYAVDVALGTGSKIKATHDGVIRAGADGIYGYFVEVKSKCDGRIIATRYAHLVEAMDYDGNQEISRGDVIGRVNNTGSSSGPHIHYDIRGSPTKDFESYLSSKLKKNGLKGCCEDDDDETDNSCPNIRI